MPDYGIIVKDIENRISLHSDYSNLVFIGKATVGYDTKRLWATGENFYAYEDRKFWSEILFTTKYNYTLPKDLNYIIPFYKPKYLGQKIAPIEVSKNGLDWNFVVSHEGSGNGYGDHPDIYIFASMSELNPTLTDPYGLNVYGPDGVTPVFSTQYKPLRATKTLWLEPPMEYTNADYNLDMGIKNSTAQYSEGINSDTMFAWQSNSFGNKYYKESDSGEDTADRILFKKKTPWASAHVAWTHFVSCISLYNNVVYIEHANNAGGDYYERVKGSSYADALGAGVLSLSGDVFAGKVGIKIEGIGQQLLNIEYDGGEPTAPNVTAPMSATNRFKSGIMFANASDYD